MRTSLIAVTFITWGVVNPVTAPTGRHVAVQVKFAPATSEVSGTLKVAPEQIGDGAVLVKLGMGFTVTVKSVTGPLHPLACGVI